MIAGLLAIALAAGAAPAEAEFSWTLAEAPASHYGSLALHPADAAFATLVTAMGLRYDPALARAAREVARWHARGEEPAPSELLAFLLDAAGAVAWGTRQAIFVAGTEAELHAALRGRLESLAAAGETRRAGVGMAAVPGLPVRRHLVLLHAVAGVEMEPVPRSVPRSGRVVFSGTLPAGARRPTVLFLTPERIAGEATVTGSGQRFRAEVATGDAAGRLLVEIAADTRTGPAPLAQLEVWIDRPPPDAYHGPRPADESDIDSEEQAERLAASLLDRDRRRFGLEPLVRDPALFALARAHSREMCARGVVGHLSAEGEGPSERLAAARYRTVGHAENVARDPYLSQAQARLLESLGHRRNILSPRLTHVGVGAARGSAGEPGGWCLTQLFARPATVVEPARARLQALATLDRARRDRGLHPLRPDPRLDQLAGRLAREPQAGVESALDEVARLDRAYPVAWAVVLTLPEMDDLEAPAPLSEPGFERIGVGFHQDPDLEPPEITLALVALGRR